MNLLKSSKIFTNVFLVCKHANKQHSLTTKLAKNYSIFDDKSKTPKFSNNEIDSSTTINKNEAKQIKHNFTAKEEVIFDDENKKEDPMPIDWFAKLTKTDSKKVTKDDDDHDDDKNLIKAHVKFPELNDNEKKNVILQYIEEVGDEIDQDFIDENWDELINSQSYSKAKQYVTYLKKRSYYRRKAVEIKAEKAEFSKEKLRLAAERAKQFEGTNIPTFNCVTPTDKVRKTEQNFRVLYMNNLVAEHINSKENKMPSVIFDFRYVKSLTNIVSIKSSIRQFSQAVHDNLRSLDPFKIKYYNYSPSSRFHKTFFYGRQLFK
jgi:L-rhamnose mutarotase